MNVYVHTAVSIDTKRDGFALDNRFRSSTDSSDGCRIVAVPITIGIEINSRCPKVGRKRRPPTHGPREKQSDKEHRSPHQFIQK